MALYKIEGNLGKSQNDGCARLQGPGCTPPSNCGAVSQQTSFMSVGPKHVHRYSSFIKSYVKLTLLEQYFLPGYLANRIKL